MGKNIGSFSYLIEYFYSHFISRDITYIFAGAVLIYAIHYSIKGCGYIPKKFSFTAFVYLVASYFIGLAISEFAHIVRIVRKGCPFPKKYNNKGILLYQDLIENYHPYVLNRHERTIYLMHVGAAVGAAALFGALSMFALQIIKFRSYSFYTSSEYIFIEVMLFVYASFMIPHSWWKRSQMKNNISALVKNLESKNKKR